VIPSLDPLTGNLPPGQYDAAWDEIVSTYGYNLRHLVLLQGLRAVLDNLAAARCTRAYLNGSFVTAKTTPGDFDLCFEPVGINQAILDRERTRIRDGTSNDRQNRGCPCSTTCRGP